MAVKKAVSRFNRGRFAPSTTGEAHPGTLLAGLLCWLDARSSGAEVLLRMEDLDLARTKPGYVAQLESDLAWFGLDWDSRSLQSEAHARHSHALDVLVGSDRVYACECSRAGIRAKGRPAPDGSQTYAGTCRGNRVTSSDWRTDPRPLRLELEADDVLEVDESGSVWEGDAASLFGDPILRRRDGAFAYHFVSVLDDANAGVDRVTRGSDLGPSTILQVALQRTLGLPTPSYRHHCLFLERRHTKLSKLHGAVGARALREFYTAGALCGALASFVGLVPPDTDCRPEDLVGDFDWEMVSRSDVELTWSSTSGLAWVDADSPLSSGGAVRS
jgi:glutamyl-Q tRNA(Asp) synthetase